MIAAAEQLFLPEYMHQFLWWIWVLVEELTDDFRASCSSDACELFGRCHFDGIDENTSSRFFVALSFHLRSVVSSPPPILSSCWKRFSDPLNNFTFQHATFHYELHTAHSSIVRLRISFHPKKPLQAHGRPRGFASLTLLCVCSFLYWPRSSSVSLAFFPYVWKPSDYWTWHARSCHLPLSSAVEPKRELRRRVTAALCARLFSSAVE